MSFLSYLINGISLGSVYAIIALGYTMVYGIARMLNFGYFFYFQSFSTCNNHNNILLCFIYYQSIKNSLKQ